MTLQQQSLLHTLGIATWMPRKKDHRFFVEESTHTSNNLIDKTTGSTPREIHKLLDHSLTPTAKTPPFSQPKESTDPTTTINCQAMGWNKLESTINKCQRCDLHQTRSNTVFGAGNKQANLLVIGEAPNAFEDIEGLPFLDQSGQLLTNMLKSINIDRDTIYLTNLLKCRPPNNRSPYKNELYQCNAYLEQQIRLISPKLILVLGRVTAQALLQESTNLANMRGIIHHYSNSNIPLIVSYHPSYLLRMPSEKKKSWADLRFVSQQLNALLQQ